MRVYSIFLLVLSQCILQFITHKKILTLNQKREQKDNRNTFCANACKYLRNKLVEVAKVFEITKENMNLEDVSKNQKI